VVFMREFSKIPIVQVINGVGLIAAVPISLFVKPNLREIY